MLLSQLRWLGALAIGVAVMIAMFLDPDVKPATGRPAPAPAEARSSVAPSGVVLDEEFRKEAYEKAREALIENTPEGSVREAALASLRRQYFPEARPPETTPTPSATPPDEP